MFNFFTKKHKYLNCPYLKHSLHFFYDEIRACCSNAKGPVFYTDFDNLDWNKVYTERKKYIHNINHKYEDGIPPECKGCFEINNYLQDYKIENFENTVDRIYFQNNMTCNAKCTYCTFKEVSRGYKYKALPFVKQLISRNILSKDACIYMSGGEITISPEFEELLREFINFLNNKVEILTSGIKYCKSIEEGFIQDKIRLVISLDSACRETYFKIKQVDCFDTIIQNLQNYIKASEHAKDNITLKYILLDNINDNSEELNNFIELVNNLGIKNIRLDINYNKYKFNSDTKVPEHYYNLYKEFNNKAQTCGLTIQKCEQVEAVLNKK